VSHDDNGKIVGKGEMEAQMRQAYSNIHKVLTEYGAIMDNIVDETLFVTIWTAPLQRQLNAEMKYFLAHTRLL
jgi:2-iminobutanoate/2-iminopropanoate deaminase